MKQLEDVYKDLNLFMGMIYNAYRLPMWCFSMKKELFYTSCPNENEMNMLLNAGGCLDYAVAPERNMDKPLYLSDSIGLIWIADYIWNNGKPMLLVMIGPVFSSESSFNMILESLRRMDYSIPLRNSLIQKLRLLPVLSVHMLNQYASMLHYLITGEPQPEFECEYQADFSEKSIKYGAYNYEDDNDFKEKDEALNQFNSWTQMAENEIMQAIRSGNVNFKMLNSKTKNIMSKVDHYEAKNINRDEKNTVIIFFALCSRAAMDGGLSPKTARQMQVDYIGKAENTRTTTELAQLVRIALHDFINKVHDCKVNSGISKPVQDVCDYVQRNLTHTLELSEIAKEIGYAEYYLTKKFRKEMGMRLTDYINNSKIEMAKVLLLTTTKSIQEISDQMNFGTRNYFSKVFQAKVGMSPADYRKRSLNEERSEE